MSVVLVSLPHFDHVHKAGQQSLQTKAVFPAILLASAAALLTVWAATMAGLLNSWVVLSFAWLFLLWTMAEERAKAGALLRRGGALLLGPRTGRSGRVSWLPFTRH